jgi:hypothetical protein
VMAALQIKNIPTGAGDDIKMDVSYARGDTKDVISTAAASPSFAIFSGTGRPGAPLRSLRPSMSTRTRMAFPCSFAPSEISDCDALKSGGSGEGRPARTGSAAGVFIRTSVKNRPQL